MGFRRENANPIDLASRLRLGDERCQDEGESADKGACSEVPKCVAQTPHTRLPCGERMRAGGPVERVVGLDPARPQPLRLVSALDIQWPDMAASIALGKRFSKSNTATHSGFTAMRTI